MKNVFIILVLFAFLGTGCSSFLDVKSDAKLVVPHTIDDIQAILDDYDRVINSMVPALGVGASDEYYLLESTYKLFDVEDREFYVWNYLDYFGNSNDWGIAYQPIYNANLALDLLKNVDMTSANQEKWRNIKGSALFYRSFYFYHLLVVFGQAFDESTSNKDLGIALRLTSDFNVKSFRSTVQQCFDQIESDVKASIELLPDHPIFVTRPSKAAAHALLARLYLYKRDYSQALKYAELALNIKSDLMDFNGDSDILTTVGPKASPFKQFNKETIFYAELSLGRVFYSSGSRIGVVDSLLFRSYEDGDLREYLFYHTSNGLAYYRGSYTSNSAQCFGGLSTNELYLITAECFAIQGENSKARNELVKLLQMRYESAELQDLSQINDTELLQYIRNERRKELVFTGLRFSDIKRYNREGAKIILRRKINGKEYILEPNSKKYALPLPADLVALTGMEQN